METFHLSKQDARSFLLAHQGLGRDPAFIGKEGICAFIRRVGCIQFDPLNMAGRNPELVLQARVPDFRPETLQELLYVDRLLLDGWDKVMSIYPREDFPYFARFREAARARYLASEPVREAAPHVRRELANRGPLSSTDLHFDETVDWPWAPTRLSRAVLESMYFWGELVVHRKKNNQKIYDLASRHLPASLLDAPEPHPSDEAYMAWRVERRIGGVGLLWERPSDAWVGIPGLKGRTRADAFQRLRDEDRIVEVLVEGGKRPFYARSADWERERVRDGGSEQTRRAVVMGPLDNLLWDRNLIRELFGFDYVWEVYKPAKERKYGYYVLPILYGDRFVARFEPGRVKKGEGLPILGWWWEPDAAPDEEMMEALAECFRGFLRFLGEDAIRFKRGLAKREKLERLLRL